MSDRLRELLRQRALLHEHLAWLDREIREAEKTPDHSSLPTGTAPPAPSLPAPLPVPAFPAPAHLHTAPALTAAAIPRLIAGVAQSSASAPPGAETILDQYRGDSRNLKQDVRKGCFLYFAAALLLVGLGVTVLYFAIGSR